MTRDTYIRLMDGTYCQRNELPDYTDKDVFIPVLQKSAKFVKSLEDEYCTITTRLIGIYGYYLLYVNDVYLDDDSIEFNEKYLTLYNFRYFTSSTCSGNSIFWKRGNSPVIVDIDANKICSLDGKEQYLLKFKTPITSREPFAYWDFNGIIDCVSNEEDIAIQVRDAWERPESHTLIIHSNIPNDNSSSIGTFEVTHDQDEKLMGRLLSIKDSKVYIQTLRNDKTKLCVFDLYGNMIEEIDYPSMRDEWIKEQNDISYKLIIRLGSSLFVEYKSVKRNFIPIVYNMEGIPDVRFLQTRLKSNGLLNDNKPYYVQWYWNTRSIDSNLSRQLSAISSYNGLATFENTQYFESMRFKTIAKSISCFRNNIQPEQEVLAWIPYDLVSNESLAIKELRKALDSCNINYITGTNCKMPETDSKKIVFIIDLETDKQRQKSLTNTVIRQCPNNEPFVVFISLMKIIDELDLVYFKAANKLKKERNMARRESIVKLSYDEETAIMNSLAGHGPNPEVFGF